MRIFVSLLLCVCAVLAVSILPGRISYWNAAKEDYATAVERIAAIEADWQKNITLSDLSHLNDLPPEIATKSHLTRLDLSNTRITDLSPLAKLKNLNSLSLNNVPVRDLSPLSRLENLENLSISRTWIFDLAPLSGLSRLKQLNLSYTAVKSLKPVMQLQRIEQLTLYTSYAHDGSQAYYEELKRNLPRVNNGNAYRQDYKPGWLYRMKIRYKRLKQSWMIDRPKIS